MFHAINNSNPTLVKTIIEHNPDLNVRNLKGVCLIDAAKEKPDLYDVIRKHMSTVRIGRSVFFLRCILVSVYTQPNFYRIVLRF